MKKQTNMPACGRKLSLNKKTISNLTAAEMNGQVGGGYTIRGNTCIGHKTCFTCRKTCN